MVLFINGNFQKQKIKTKRHIRHFGEKTGR